MIISKNYSRGLLLLLFTLSACESSDPSAKAKPSSPAHQVEIMTAAVNPVSLQQTITGTLEASTIVHLHNEVSGRITDLPYYEGDSVKQGTAIINLDDKLIQAEMEKAVAQKQQAALDLKRLKKLITKKLASEEDLTRARTELEITTAEVKLQRTRLSQTVMRAPFNGIITERNYEPGDVVPQHSHILTLIDPSSLHIKMQLSESWLPLIEQKDAVEITIDALGANVHEGRISRIHPTIDPNTRKGIVEVKFVTLPAEARSGQLARITIRSTPMDRLLIPSFVVRHDSTGAYIFIVSDDNKAIKTYVKKGLSFGDNIEIVEGLLVNQNVIIKGFTALRDGLSVEIVTPDKDST